MHALCKYELLKFFQKQSAGATDPGFCNSMLLGSVPYLTPSPTQIINVALPFNTEVVDSR